ncbi:MAG TPA: acyl-CoA dehydrogenase [Chthoniobacterales bacterium]|nr:acyl-CoA dehydrogenase [Chthoniobacterales bacterium]
MKNTVARSAEKATPAGEIGQPLIGAEVRYPPTEQPRTGFELAAMQRLLDGEHWAVRELVKQIISQPEFRYFESTDHHAYRKQVLAWTKRLADAGIGRIFMPKYVGGDEDPAKFMAAGETLGFHDLSLMIKFGVQFGLFAGSIQRLGTEPHHHKYLIDAASCRLMGCFAMTEIGHGSNVQALETTAAYDPAHEQFVVHSPTFSAGKAYIGNAANDARMAIVFAQLEIGGEQQGVHPFLVPLRDENGRAFPGITIEDDGYKMGLNGVDNGRIWFDHVRVPRTALLNRFGDVDNAGKYQSRIKSPSARFFSMISTLVGGRIAIAASGNSAAKSALTIAIRYAARRRQFGPGKPPGKETLLLDYPATQRRLMPLLANAYAIDFALKHLIALTSKTADDVARTVETLAAGLKAWSTWNTTRTIQAGRESCGGEGYIAANRFAALKADTDIFTTFEGDNTVLMQLAAKNLLTDLKDRIKDMRPVELTGFLLNQRMSGFTRTMPLFTLNTSRYHLLDTNVQLGYFKYRESSLLLQVAGAFRRLTKNREMDAYSAFTKLQPELLELADAFVEREILERFGAVVENVSDRTLHSPLRRLRDLFALYHLELHKGWYLENHAMSGFKAKAISRLVTALCTDIRQDAVALVDAFGIPDSCLAARIAL